MHISFIVGSSRERLSYEQLINRIKKKNQQTKRVWHKCKQNMTIMDSLHRRFLINSCLRSSLSSPHRGNSKVTNYGSTIWLDDEDDESEISEKSNELSARIGPEGCDTTSEHIHNDHKIRIEVNSSHEDKSNSSDVSSCASVSVIEILSKFDVESEKTNSVSESPQKRHEFRLPYNEKAIDVPEDFEQEAYGKIGQSPFVRSFNRRQRNHINSSQVTDN